MDRMLRPKATVLPESAMVPDRNVIRPPPTQFTHEVVAGQPYYYSELQKNAPPDGTFTAGTKVVLLKHEGKTVCWVVDGRGLCVVTAFDGLRPLH